MKKSLRSTVAKIGAATGAMALSAAASAGELAAAFTTEVEAAKAELMLIGGSLMIVAGVIVLIRSGRKAANS